MRNLRNVKFDHWHSQDVTATCWDPVSDQLLCTVGPTPQSSTIELVRLVKDSQISPTHVAKWEAPSPSPDLPADKVLHLQYVGGTGAVCAVFEGGDIVTVQEDAAASAQIEIVGSIDAGIAGAAWSPDEELLAVVTKINTLVLLGSSFDPVVEVPMSPEDLKASKHVSVGWGKKDTQFQGRGAKALRDPTIPEKVDEGRPSTHEDGKTTVSWRGDGTFVAINTIVEGGRRAIRVYSREGELDSVSEPVDGLESTLSWRPAGNLLAGVQRQSDSIDVVFFERNGLRHGGFTLRSSHEDVTLSDKIHLSWNIDSTVLAVLTSHTVQLWTMGNYHWYLKQEVTLDMTAQSLSWHPERALRLAAVSTSGVTMSEYIFHTARGGVCPPHDVGAVAVIDGTKVKLTPFRAANMPPPMSLYETESETSVADVAFGVNSTSFVVLHQTGLDVFEWPWENGRPTKPKLLQQLSLTTGDKSQQQVPLQVACISDTEHRCLIYQDGSQRSIRVTGAGVTLGNESQVLASTASFEDRSSIEAYGQDSRGRLYKLDPQGDSLLHVQFPSFLPWFEISKIDGETTAFGLSRNGHLYANSRVLAKSCTSFLTTPSHLIFTTNNHLVKYVHLTANVEDLHVPGDDPETDERCRSVERGSRLVTAIPTNMSIVLQMPRGNLETIYPRAMVVAGIRELIDVKNYARAFSYCRTQRVDMNILYDHQPAQFLSNVGLFLDQLRDITSIDLFLSSLKEEDVTQTMYRDTRTHKVSVADTEVDGTQPGASAQASSKVNTICDAVLKSLQPRKTTHLQSIITAHVCKQPPALDDGLTLVAELMREDEKMVDRAIEHICFLVDVNRLYENALGLYNLHLALLVAQQSQRDPKEYLPFIQNLHKLPELRRKFEIDDYLTRKTNALRHLHTMDVFEELCNYTVKHDLYQDALKLYRYDDTRLRTLTELYATHLEATSALREAGLAYESLHNYSKATSCYRAAGSTCWQECLFTAQQQTPPLSLQALSDLASVLADALWEARDYSSAATIYTEYLSNPEQAIKCLCKGYLFAQAIRLAQQQSTNLLEKAVDPGLADSLASTTEFLADCKAQLLAQVPRIAELRRKAIEDPLSFYEGERIGGADIPDDVSIAASSRISTSASLFTRYTGKTTGGGSLGTVGTGVSRATSKNRRREEKKRARGRKGTVYEEEYLCNSVRRLIERVDGTREEVERLVFALVRRGMHERARAVEALMSDVTDACEQTVAQVFPGTHLSSGTHDGAQPQQQDGGGEEVKWRATGGDAVLQEFVEARGKAAEPPIVTRMRRLSLLG